MDDSIILKFKLINRFLSNRKLKGLVVISRKLLADNSNTGFKLHLFTTSIAWLTFLMLIFFSFKIYSYLPV